MTGTTSGTPAATTYTFDNSSPDAQDQVRYLAQILDPHTFAVLDGLNLPVGGRFADLGAGAGTVTGWLIEQGGPDSHVVVVDQDPRHVREHPQLTVVAQDVATVDVPPGSLDLVHARLLFMHLENPEQVLRRWVTALKPGAAMVISDWATDHLEDMFVDGPDPVRAVFDNFQDALINIAENNGMDSTWARRVPSVMRRAGLHIHSGETYNRLWRGGEPGMLLHASNSRQLQGPLLTAGISIAELELLRESMNDPSVTTRSWPMHTTVGIRPTA
jgi:SAM-dependent methyltransferase